jgi:NTE family protein
LARQGIGKNRAKRINSGAIKPPSIDQYAHVPHDLRACASLWYCCQGAALLCGFDQTSSPRRNAFSSHSIDRGNSMLRRDLLKSIVASVPGALAIAPAGAEASSELETMAGELTKELYANDGLALPIPITPTVSGLAKGRDRTLVLGGGGEYYLAWYCGFFHGLYEHGLDMNAMSEMVVGTSAGAYMGSSLTSGHFLRLRSEFNFFGHFPSLFADLTPLSSSNPSQQRAMKLSAAAKDGEISTLRTIGRAALAADNSVNGSAVSLRLIWMLTGDSRTDWPVAKIYTSSIDCYTGERLIISQVAARKNGISLGRGAAASSSLPGVIGPTLLGQRYGMDGGICSNATHVDVVAGSKRAIVITITDGLTPPFYTGVAHRHADNIKQLEATDTKVLWIIANPPTDISLLDPKQIHPALHSGYERAKTEASKIKAFWA